MAWGEDEGEDEATELYEMVSSDPVWTEVHRVAVNGTYFAHRKHPAEVEEGVAHKFMVWHCEARKPATHCWCKLYAIQWQER